jgi:hypothetical protein
MQSPWVSGASVPRDGRARIRPPAGGRRPRPGTPPGPPWSCQSRTDGRELLDARRAPLLQAELVVEHLDQEPLFGEEDVGAEAPDEVEVLLDDRGHRRLVGPGLDAPAIAGVRPDPVEEQRLIQDLATESERIALSQKSRSSCAGSDASDPPTASHSVRRKMLDTCTDPRVSVVAPCSPSASMQLAPSKAWTAQDTNDSPSSASGRAAVCSCSPRPVRHPRRKTM